MLSGRENYSLVGDSVIKKMAGADADDAALDELSKELYSLGYQGQMIFGLLIFLTTIPPLPLYSTLMVLCGYTFGVWEGFVVSYIASLTGAIIVFLVSRTLLRDVITKRYVSSMPLCRSRDVADPPVCRTPQWQSPYSTSSPPTPTSYFSFE